jgi:hypothetical protein
MLVALAAVLVIIVMHPMFARANTPPATDNPPATELVSPPSDEETDGVPDGGTLEVKQDGTDFLYSTDGGKTWSRSIPKDAGMSLNMEVVEE